MIVLNNRDATGVCILPEHITAIKYESTGKKSERITIWLSDGRYVVIERSKGNPCNKERMMPSFVKYMAAYYAGEKPFLNIQDEIAYTGLADIPEDSSRPFPY